MSRILTKQSIKTVDKNKLKKVKAIPPIEYEPVNEVFLVGRVTSLAVEKVWQNRKR